MAKTNLSTEERDNVVDLYNDGLTMRQVAARVNRSYGAVYDCLVRAQELGKTTIRASGGMKKTD